MRERRVAANLTQEDLAERVGRSQEWVGKVESGEIPTPRDDSLRGLEQALGLSLSDLYVAMNRARTKGEGDRIAASLPVEEDDPSIRALMVGAQNLRPAGRRALVEHMRTLERFQQEYEQEASRDALEDRGSGR